MDKFVNDIYEPTKRFILYGNIGLVCTIAIIGILVECEIITDVNPNPNPERNDDIELQELQELQE